MPDVPTLSEFVTGYEVIGWNGIGAPRSTPSEVIDKLNSEINAGLTDPKIKARFITSRSANPALSDAANIQGD